MNPNKVIKKLSSSIALPQKRIKHVVSAMVEVIHHALSKDRTVFIPGLGSFYTQHRIDDQLKHHDTQTQANSFATPAFSLSGEVSKEQMEKSKLPIDYISMIASITKLEPELVKELIETQLVQLIHHTIASGGYVPIAGLGTFVRRKVDQENCLRFYPSSEFKEAVDPNANVRHMLTRAIQGNEPYASNVSKINDLYMAAILTNRAPVRF